MLCNYLCCVIRQETFAYNFISIVVPSSLGSPGYTACTVLKVGQYSEIYPVV
jgi:hypothetical protein